MKRGKKVCHSRVFPSENFVSRRERERDARGKNRGKRIDILDSLDSEKSSNFAQTLCFSPLSLFLERQGQSPKD